MKLAILITFFYLYNDDLLKCEHKGPKDQAIVECGVVCFDHFTKDKKIVSESEGLAIIDVCANPKERK